MGDVGRFARALPPFCRCTRICGKALDLSYYTNGEVTAQAIPESLPESFSPITCLNFVYARLLPSLKQSGREDNYILPPCLIIPPALVESSDSMNLKLPGQPMLSAHSRQIFLCQACALPG
jgi:hypothetical protein